MTVRYDDSLEILANVIIDSLGRDALSKGVALRDVSGRLAFFCSSHVTARAIKRTELQLRSALGVYGRSDRIIANNSEYGVAEVLADTSILIIRVGGHTVRLLDRRLVGADWLRRPAPAKVSPPRFVFASLKGGVGRSTALAVAAADIAAKGRRVLAIDMDMEAPGLGAMLLADDDLPEFGLIDALVENGLSPLNDEFYADLHAPSNLADQRGRIDVIPAIGLRSARHPADVLGKLARAYADDVDEGGTVSTILDQVAAIVDRFASTGTYDAIMIDARAGLHETTAAAILGLGAEVFLFGLDEYQTFLGYSILFSHLALFLESDKEQRPEWLERITMVQGRASEKPELREQFAASCQRLFESSGLTLRPNKSPTDVPLPAEPFGDVPWNDEVGDEELQLDEPVGPRATLAILDDERFRVFNPRMRRDLLSSAVYRSSYGELIDRIAELVAVSNRI